MSEKVSDDVELDIPVFRSLGMKIPDQPIEDGCDNSNLSDIDVTALYQKEPFSENNSKGFSKTSFILVFLVFIILIITIFFIKTSWSP